MTLADNAYAYAHVAGYLWKLVSGRLLMCKQVAAVAFCALSPPE